MCLPGQSRMSCDDGADCGPGSVCCASFDGAWRTDCVPSCGAEQFQLCGGDDECATMNCSDVVNAAFLEGYERCF